MSPIKDVSDTEYKPPILEVTKPLDSKGTVEIKELSSLPGI